MLSGLIWVQTVWKYYQQTTKVSLAGKEFMHNGGKSNFQDRITVSERNKFNGFIKLFSTWLRMYYEAGIEKSVCHAIIDLYAV